MKFTLGGVDSNKYPGFNGQLRNIKISLERGAFVDSLGDLNKKIGDDIPKTAWDRRVIETVVGKIEKFRPGIGKKEEKQVGGGKNSFPDDYAISGWFNFDSIYN